MSHTATALLAERKIEVNSITPAFPVVKVLRLELAQRNATIPYAALGNLTSAAAGRTGFGPH